MSVQTAKAFEHTSALLALESFIPIQIVHSQNVSPQVSSLGELHAAEAASVRLLPCVPQDVSVKRLFLCESFSTLCTLERAHTSVDSLVARNLTWFAELFTAELATQFERVSCHRTFPLLDQLQARLQLLVPQQMLLVGLGGLAHLVAGLADEASSLRFSVMVSTSSWCVAISSLVVSSFVLLQLSFCSKLLAALEGG